MGEKSYVIRKVICNLIWKDPVWSPERTPEEKENPDGLTGLATSGLWA